MDRSYFRKLIRRYVDGNGSSAEKYIVDRWYDSLEADRKETILQSKDQQGDADFQQRILNKTINKGKLLHLGWSIPLIMKKIAAVVVISAGIGAFIHHYLGEQGGTVAVLDRFRGVGAPSAVFTTDFRQVKQIVLPDSSVAFLNANSTLEVLPGFGKKGRQLRLAGEAYFEVRPDADQVFTVFADSLQVSVLGTSFNVQAYDQTDQIRVAVSSGKVAVSGASESFNLTQGEQLEYAKINKEFVRTSHRPEIHTAWKSGTVILINADFMELSNSIYNMYGVKLSTMDPTVADNLYNFTVRSSRTLEETLKQLCTMIRKNYRKEGKTIIIE